MSLDEMDTFLQKNVPVQVEDVIVVSKEKTTNPDAIHLFPRSMYESGNLHITGNEIIDKLASPASQVPSDMNNSTDSPKSTSPRQNENIAHTETHPHLNESPSVSINENDYSSQSESCTPPAITPIIAESDLYAYFYDSDDDTTPANNDENISK